MRAHVICGQIFVVKLRSSYCCCMNVLHNRTSVLRLCVELCVLHCGRVGGAESKVVSVRDEGVWGECKCKSTNFVHWH